MSHDCLLAICHKKGEYMEIRGDCFWLYRLYLGDMICIFGFDVFTFTYGLYMLRGDTLCCFCFYISCFTYGTLILIYIMRLFMVYVFYFMFCEIKKFIMFYLYFPHIRLCVC